MTLTATVAHWYALHVRPSYEIAVATRLQDLGVEEYLPLYKGPRVARRNRFNEGPPLFPGYVFSYLDLAVGPRLYAVPGVLRILGHGGRATPIEDDEIAMVRAIVESRLRIDPAPYFQPGEKICLIDGPLRGVSGTFLRSRKGNKLVVSLPLLKRSLAVTVLPEWVVAEASAQV